MLQRQLDRLRRRLLQLLHRYLIFFLIVLLGLGLSIACLGTYKLSLHLVEAQALHYAKVAVQTLNEARQLYSGNVVKRVEGVNGVTVGAEYHQAMGGIPNPATYTIELGDRLSDAMQGRLFRLYSDYPFPNRADTGGPQDLFETEALVYLKAHPDDAFYRKEILGDRLTFRYTEAVKMQASCVSCHNSLANSPKKNWRVGDVRGIVEITQPLDSVILLAQDGVKLISGVLTIIIGLAIAGIMIVVNRLRFLNRDLEAQVSQRTEELHHLAITDSLTGLANRRHFETVFQAQLQLTQREQQPLSLLMCDVDHFKTYNDSYGHQAGDQCLQAIAQVLQSYTQRSGELAARYGGEEFVLLLPNVGTTGVTKLATLIRAAIHRLNLEHRASTTAAHVTISMGLTTITPTVQTTTQDLIKTADTALYQAKEEGRDRFIFLHQNH